MKSIFRFVLFFIAMFVEVRIHAANLVALPNDPNVLMRPNGCSKGSGECLVQTSGGKFRLTVGDGSVLLSPKTTVVRKSSSEIVLVKGSVWVVPKTRLSVRTEFGVADGSSDFWVIRAEKKMTVRGMFNAVHLASRDNKDAIIVYPGIESSISAADSTGRLTVSVPAPVPFDEQLVRWAQLFPGTKDEFKEQAEEYHQVWSKAVDQVSQLQQSLVQRRIASLEEQQRLDKQRKEAAMAEIRSLQQLFHQKNDIRDPEFGR